MIQQSFEGGFTKISNGLLEAIMHYPTSGLKKDILLFLIRYTYGYQRSMVDLSLNELSMNLRRTRAKVARALKELINCKVISEVREFNTAHQSRSLAINIDTTLWKPGCRQSGKQSPVWDTVSQKGYRPVAHPGYRSVFHTGNSKVSESIENKGQNATPKKYLKKEKKIYSLNSVEFRLSSLLLSLIKEKHKEFRDPDLQKWCTHIDRMLSLDKRSPEEIENVIRWCQNDNFWFLNVLCTNSLRDKYDRLAMEMKEKAKRNNSLNQNKSHVSESDRIRL